MDTKKLSALIVRLQQDDQLAMKEIYYGYRLMIQLYAKKYVQSSELIEEAVNDVFLKLWQFRHRIDESSNFRNLLITICKNHLINCHLHTSRKAWLKSQHTCNPMVCRNAGEERLEEEDTCQRILLRYEKLPEQSRYIFGLSRWGYKNYDEIAEELGLSRDTVRLHLIKSVKFLKQELARSQ